MPTMAMASPALPKSLPATEAASAEAPMFTTRDADEEGDEQLVRLREERRERARASAPCCSASSLSRARPSEK